jgi:Zn-dependent protease with chaperone function
VKFANESRLLDCRKCGAQNRLSLERALTQPGASRCGRCKSPLLRGREVGWRGLDAGAYQHPLDRDTLDAVREIPGVDSLLKKLIENTFERYDRLFHQASFVRAGDGQLPTLNRLFLRAADQLGAVTDSGRPPDLYLYTDPVPNARCGGVERPYVAVSTGLVDLMDDDEVGAVFAHELSHWHCKHVLYKTATQLLVHAASLIATATLGIGSLLIVPLRLALLKWDRCSELSADRGMLLATRDLELSMRVLFKLAGGSFRLRDELSLDKFVEQAEAAARSPEEGMLDRVFSLLQTLYRTHPFPLWRASELLKWACEGGYLALLQSDGTVVGEVVG